MITGRAVTGLQDLRRAEAVLTRAWLAEPSEVASHVGDLEWWYGLAAPDDLASHLRLWGVDGDVTAWSWVNRDQVLWEVKPGETSPIVDAILAEAIQATAGPLRAWASEDDLATIATLARLGFEPGPDRLSQFRRRVDDGSPIPDGRLRDGYRIRAIDGPAEVPARVAVHRAAFEHSSLTLAHYERLTALPHYRFEDDLVVEAPDGTLAAFAMAWWDPVARVGEFEPVGTRPDHQRRGLGRALLSHALRRYRDAGATTIQIYSHADNEASEGLYQAVGFVRSHYRRRYERSLGGDVRSSA